MDFFRRPAFLVLFTLALVFSIAWSYFGGKKKETEATTTSTEEAAQIVNLTNIDPADYETFLKDELALANSKALEASNQNKLAAQIVELPADLLPNKGLTRYVYVSDADKKNNWVITFSQNSNNYIRSLIPRDDYLGTLPVMNTALWKFNYITALQIAEKNGGLDWREKNTLTGVKLTLNHTPPKNWLTWTVEYQNEGVGLTKVIDANSGNIIDSTTLNQ